jgi:ABC-2 type transport system permease protein
VADGLRTAFVDGRFAALPLVVLLGWGALGTALAARLFRWSE